MASDGMAGAGCDSRRWKKRKRRNDEAWARSGEGCMLCAHSPPPSLSDDEQKAPDELSHDEAGSIPLKRAACQLDTETAQSARGDWQSSDNFPETASWSEAELVFTNGGFESGGISERTFEDTWSFVERCRQLEADLRPSPRYMEEIQQGINSRMRRVVIEWLLDLDDAHDFQSETVHLAVHCFDRFLSKCKTERTSLQLLGGTAMMLASKYSERAWRNLTKQDIVYYSDNSFAVEEVARMERGLLKALECRLACPSPFVFLADFFLTATKDKRLGAIWHDRQRATVAQNCARMLIDLSLLEYSMLRFPPSLWAAGAVSLTLQLVYDLEPRTFPWMPTGLERIVDAAELHACACEMWMLLLSVTTVEDPSTVLNCRKHRETWEWARSLPAVLARYPLGACK
mmetsp:Transcript_30376/g.70078  ORF Transcript_30376/g.70078 Transcript_30376/m.70078 type:complete len:401 (+) Transcript_30376:34-1236(+)